MPGQQFVKEIERPQNVVDNEQDYGMIVIPAYHQWVNTQSKINNAFIPAAHPEFIFIAINQDEDNLFYNSEENPGQYNFFIFKEV